MSVHPDLPAAIEHGRRPNGVVDLTTVRALTAATPEDRAVAADMDRAARDEASIARERGMEGEP